MTPSPNSTPPQARWILHADMDAFYASIEQRDRPELRGRPVIVGATSPRGVVAAASYEARRFGVRSAMPGFRARQLCPDGVYLPSNMPLYARVSEQVHEIFREFTPAIQPIALDEAFLDITGSLGLHGSPLELGRKLKKSVRASLDLPISVGIANSKLVAKLACTFSKPDGLLFVPPEVVNSFLWPLPIRRLWGVGPVLGSTLERLGIDTIGRLAQADAEKLSRDIGDRAFALKRLAQGLDDREVEADLEPKSYGEENTFEHDVTDKDRVTATLTAHAEAVARRLRRDRYRGRTITVKIKLGRRTGTRTARLDADVDEPRYPVLSRSKTLPFATSDGKVIRDVAIGLWDAARIEEPVRLLGVSVSGLQAVESAQLELFTDAGAPGDRLGSTLDAIAAKFGREAVHRAVEDPGKITASNQRKRGE